MIKEVKKLFLVVFLILSLIPLVYAFNLLDFFKGGMESITGMDTLTVTINVGNNAPNITTIEFDGGTLAPSEGGIRTFEFSFLANDTESSGNLNNSTAKLNVSYSALNNENTSCTSEYVPVDDAIRYNCTIQMQYYYTTASTWAIAAEISDNNGNSFQNTTATFTYSQLTGENLSSPSSLSFPAVTPSQTNTTSTTTMRVENTGNKATLDITTTLIDLGGASGKIIPAGNFSVFNSTTGTTECDSTNQSGAATPGVLPLVGINNTAIYAITSALAVGQGSYENLYYCLFDAPSDLQSETYDTTAGGSWSIVTS